MEQQIKRIMSGESRGAGASILRGILALVEPLYATVIQARNTLYDAGTFTTHRVRRPVICVGNITAGGTGKTPVVQWLARQLQSRGHRPAVLLRGYRSHDGQSDEQQLLESALTNVARVVVDPDRVRACRSLIDSDRQIDVILLDDGFQHRGLARNFDLVLIDATDPFGFDHVLPRGLLREPLEGLGRASAFLLTRVDQASPDQIESIISKLRMYNGRAPVYQCRHALRSIATRDGQISVEQARGRRLFAFCGIGNPQSFTNQLVSHGVTIVGSADFADHHHYRADDLRALAERAGFAGAEALITTEKDWVKIKELASKLSMPIWRAELEIKFSGDDEQRLLEQIDRVVGWPSAPASSVAGLAGPVV